MKLFNYPLNSMCLVLAFHPFSVFGGTWFWLQNYNRTEEQKAEAMTQWSVRFLCFTLSYRRQL